MKSKLEYIWLDGYTPTQSLRSKTMVRENFGGTLEECPMWSFDGSSTEQADGSDSDCLLKPVAIIPDPDRNNSFLVMTEVLNADGSAHVSNGRATIDEADDDDEYWFGFEQEYFLWDTETNRPPASPPAVSLTLRAPTTAPWEAKTLLVAPSSKSTWTCAWKPA
ncbi:glutamine synthetase beta-grasp domain-containing protein [Halioglobus japonicus]|uniref:glutamine synthetase beta-grasp domain-containing protein n=1 Tax=Halioglobus japonicus TaxID=930805 RepID=UPI001F0AB241|nr:glutamine synthetase beta-grasp domain-containing protein [Halioglobus japonicus]